MVAVLANLIRRALSTDDYRQLPYDIWSFFYQAEICVRSGSAEEIIKAVEAFGPLAFRERNDAAKAFWEKLLEAAKRLSNRRMSAGRVRTVWGVTPIASLKYLVQADRNGGAESESIVFTQYYTTSEFDINLGKAQDHIIQERNDLFYAFRMYVHAWSLIAYDVFHLYNDRGFVEPAGGYGSDRFGIALVEMQDYAASGKALFTYAYGADYRMRNKTLASGEWSMCMDCPEPGKFCLCDDDGGQRALQTIAANATRMVGFGLSMDFLPDAHFMRYLVVDIDELCSAAKPKPRISDALIVGHFPNHGHFKGTRFLEAAIDQLQSRGVAVELLKLSGLPRAVILEEMKNVDVVVDQLISGSFGLTAVEAMALGVPVIAFIRPGVRIPEPSECPILQANPNTIGSLLEELVRNRQPLIEASEAGRLYVASHFSIQAMTADLRELYAAHLPKFNMHYLKLQASSNMPPSRSGAALRCRVPCALARGPIARLLARARGLARPFSWFDSPRMGFIAQARSAIRRVVSTALNRFSEWLLVSIAVPLGRRRSRARLAQGAPASLWGVTPILTLPLKARADRLLGFESRSLVFATYYIARDFDFNLQTTLEWLRRRAGGLIAPFERLLLAWALWRYDVFHYFYDQGLLGSATRFGVNPRELDLLRAAGKRIYLYAYGADVRRRTETLALGKWNFCSDCPEPGKFCACTDDYAPITSALCEKATAAVALGDMLAYVPNARNVHYWPIDLERVPPTPARPADGMLRIAHAPNHTHFKGSHYLEAIIDKLRGEGNAIDYVKVQAVPNEEVIRLFGEADLVADQFIGGAYGYTALEAMARGKPVMTYVRSPDLVDAVGECPLINVTPDTLEETLRWCLDNRDRLPAIGAQGVAYVRRWHCIEAVAARLARMYAETAAFPDSTRRMIEERRVAIEHRLATIPQAAGWEHPFLVAKGDPASPASRPKFVA